MLTHHNPEPSDPNRVVLIGASGFIATALRDGLAAAGLPVEAVGRPQLDLTSPDAADRLADLLQPTDAVVFLSAITPDQGRGIDAFSANIAMAVAVCGAIERATPAHVLYYSSDAVYPFVDGLVNEETCADPPDLYGMMHRAREELVRSSSPAPVAVVRPTLVYGVGDTHNSYGPNRLRRAARDDGRIVLFGGGEEQRDHILVDDLVALTLLVLRHRSEGLVNAATGTSISYRELAERVAGLFDPPAAVELTERQNPVTHRHFDVTQLLRAFPTFGFTPLDDGLAQAHAGMLAGADRR